VPGIVGSAKLSDRGTSLKPAIPHAAKGCTPPGRLIPERPMIARLKQLLSKAAQLDEQAPSDDSLALAMAALMVEAARMDDDFSVAERQRIVALLAGHFDLAEADAEALVERALEAVTASVEFYSWTREIKERLNEEERVGLMEMLWETVYADASLHAMEANLMRRLAGLLYVTDRNSSLARQRARQRLGLG